VVNLLEFVGISFYEGKREIQVVVLIQH
jgi:hypothetical protein